MPRRLLLLPELADESGLVAVGGDLRPARLLEAYRHGVFPWYDDDLPILWWSPDPRAIFELDGLHLARRLQRTLRAGKFTTTVNRDFAGVIRGCADRPGEGTWITADMIAAYEELHRRALVARRQSVSNLLDATATLSRELTLLVRQSRADLKPALQEIQGVVDLLNENQENLDTSLRLMAPFYRVFANTLGNGPWFDTIIENFPPGPALTTGGR